MVFRMPVVAIVLLSKPFSPSHRMRILFSILYIGWNAQMVFVGVRVAVLPYSAVGAN